MTWCDAGWNRDSLPTPRKEELSLMDGLTEEDLDLARGVEGLPAGFLTPIFQEEAVPSSNPLVVQVTINFTDPIIRSQYSLCYASSQNFFPTDTVCKGLLEHLVHSCEEFISQKDLRALDCRRRGSGILKRQRFEIIFRFLRNGTQWAERTFKSYQKQPLTINFTKKVILATHKMLEPFLQPHAENDRWLDDTVRVEDQGLDTVMPPPSEPLSPICKPRSPFMTASETFESAPGYTISLSFRSRAQRVAETHFEKVLKINSDQNAPLNLSLADELFWYVSGSIEASLSAKERQRDEVHGDWGSLGAATTCPHLDHDAVDIDLQITNNLGLSYSHLHREFRSRLTLFDGSNLGNPRDFLQDLEIQVKHARDTIDDRISLMGDSETRLLELSSPSWSIREPLEAGLDSLASGPRSTIETVLERGNNVKVDVAIRNLTSEGNRPYEVRKRPEWDVKVESKTNETPVRLPRPRQFFLVGRSVTGSRPSHDNQVDTKANQAQDKGSQDRTGEKSTHVKPTGAADIINFEDEATPTPPVLTLAVAKSPHLASPLSRIQPSAAVTDTALEESETPEIPARDEPVKIAEFVAPAESHAEDILPQSRCPEVPDESELALSDTAQLVNAVQQTEVLLEETAAIVPTSEFGLGPPIDLVRDTDLVTERSHSSARDWESASSEVTDDEENCGAPVAEQYLDTELPMIDDFARSRIEVMETFDDIDLEDNLEDGSDDKQDDGLPQALTDHEDQGNTTAPPTPGLSSGSESSPRYSILTTPNMMRTHAPANDGILAALVLDYAKKGPAPHPEESASHDNEDAPFHVQDTGVRDSEELSLPGDDDIRFKDENAAFPDMHEDETRDGDECQPGLHAADVDEDVQSASDGGNEDAELGAIVDEKESHDYRYAAELEVQEASMIELPSSPPLVSTVDTLMNPEDADVSSIDEVAFDMGATVVDASDLGSEDGEVDQSEAAADACLVSETELPTPAKIQLPPSPEIQAVDADLVPNDVVSDDSLKNSAVEDENLEGAVLPELDSSPILLSSEETQLDTDDMDMGDIVQAAPENGPRAAKEEQCLKMEEDKTVDETDAATTTSPMLETRLADPAEMQLPPSPEVRTVEADPGRENGVSDEAFDAFAAQDEGVPSTIEALDITVYETQALPESSSVPHILSSTDTLADNEDAAADAAFDAGSSISEQDDRSDNEETQVDYIEAAVESSEPDMMEWPLLPEIQACELDLQPDDVSINERLETPIEDHEGDFSHIEESHEVATASETKSIPELPSSPPLPSLEPTLVNSEIMDVDEDDSIFDIESTVNHEMFFFRAQDQDQDEVEVEEIETGATAGLVSKTITPDPEAVQVPPLPEIQASEAVLEDEDIAMTEDMAALEAEQDFNGLQNTAPDAHIDDFNATTCLELVDPQEEVPLAHVAAQRPLSETNFSSTSNVDVQVSQESDTDELPTANGTTQRDHLKEEPVSANLDTETVEAHTAFHAHSDASDLPTLFAPAISDWLLVSDPVLPEAPESVEHQHPYDSETAAVLKTSANEAEAVGVSTQQEETEATTQSAAPTSPYLTAREIPDPFDHVPSRKNSVYNGKQTEEVFDQTLEQATVPPQTPRRLTFPIPTPFSIRTSPFSPTLTPSHPPSPVLSHYSFDSRSSFSSDRPSISLNRDSVDTIAPLPEDEPQPQKEYRPSTAGWLGFHEAKPNRRFSMPLQHAWDPAGSDRGSSRPGTATSAATVRYSSYRRERKRPVLADRPRPMTSGALETVRAEDARDKKGVLPKFVMLFAGMGFASKVLGGDEKQRV